MSRTRAQRAKALEEWAGRVDSAELRLADTEGLRAIPFEFVVEGLAVSKRPRTKERCPEWEEKVREAAAERWNAEPLPDGRRVAVTITYFTEEGPGQARDVDNLAKPILDAMTKVVYCDDAQVSDLSVRIRDFETQIVNQPAGLTEYLSESRPVVHVSVDPAPSPTVEF